MTLPLFAGPGAFLFGALVLIVLLLVVARFVFGIARKLVVIGAIALGVLWLLGVVGSGPVPLG